MATLLRAVIAYKASRAIENVLAASWIWFKKLLNSYFMLLLSLVRQIHTVVYDAVNHVILYQVRMPVFEEPVEGCWDSYCQPGKAADALGRMMRGNEKFLVRIE